MVFNALPVYFDYDGRTWLIEFWKGQYGLHTGCEIGVYCSDRILRPAERSAELFHAVSDEELLPMSFVLKQKRYDRGCTFRYPLVADCFLSGCLF